MLSGATLLNYRKRYTTEAYLKKRFIKTVIPFMAWSILAFIWRVFVVSDMQFLGIRDFISNIINCNYNLNYWFFIPLFALYLSFPFLSAIRDDLKIRMYSYVALISFLTISFFPTIFSLIDIKYNANIELPIACGYIIYPLIGYIIANSTPSKKVRYLFYGLSIIGWLIRLFGVSILSNIDGEINTVFDGYTNFPAVLQSIGILLFIKQVPWEKILREKVSTLQSIATNTFGVYLIHYFIINDIHSRGFYGDISISLHIIEPFLVFGFCLGISYLISKIPILKRIIGA